VNTPPTESGESPYIIRNFQPTDFDRYVVLRAKAERLAPGGRSISPQAISEGLNRPRYSSGKDLFLVETEGAIVGYIDLISELTIGRMIVDCWIQPEHRGRGLEKRLLDVAERRARKLGVAVMQACVFEGNSAAREMFSGLDFRLVRRFLSHAGLAQKRS
jgi:ribosomal protein S18 acetylase RimI-like enzyme